MVGTPRHDDTGGHDRAGRKRRNVVLTGFMGTGKTTVGRLLADSLGYEFVDTDAVIEERHGPIPEIFRLHGEALFRTFEYEVAVDLGERDGLVVSTGGRLMLDPANAAVLGASGDVFCLVASVDSILTRVVTDDGVRSRPLLAGDGVRERIESLLAERADGYARFTQIDTDGRSPADIAVEIRHLLDAGSTGDAGTA